MTCAAVGSLRQIKEFVQSMILKPSSFDGQMAQGSKRGCPSSKDCLAHERCKVRLKVAYTIKGYTAMELNWVKWGLCSAFLILAQTANMEAGNIQEKGHLP